MTERDQAEMADMLAMFEHPGWTAFERRTQESIETLQKAMPFSLPNEAALNFAKGYMAAMQELLTLRERMTWKESPPDLDE